MQKLTGPQIPDGWIVEAVFRRDPLTVDSTRYVVSFRLTLPGGRMTVHELTGSFVVAEDNDQLELEPGLSEMLLQSLAGRAANSHLG